MTKTAIEKIKTRKRGLSDTRKEVRARWQYVTVSNGDKARFVAFQTVLAKEAARNGYGKQIQQPTLIRYLLDRLEDDAALREAVISRWLADCAASSSKRKTL
jgi:hypothetical protein